MLLIRVVHSCATLFFMKMAVYKQTFVTFETYATSILHSYEKDINNTYDTFISYSPGLSQGIKT